MIRPWLVPATLLALAVWSHAAVAACRQALALGLDVSGSVDAEEYQLQREGVARALGHPDVRAALFQMPGSAIRLMVYEWSADDYQRILLPWTDLTDPARLNQAIATLRGAPTIQRPYSTAIGSAVLMGARELAAHGDCWKRTIDISGDGKANDGPRPPVVRDLPLLEGVTVNGLIIGADILAGGDRREVEVGELSAYFRSNILRGPDAFLEVALGFEAFEEAMVRKLLREISVVAIGRLLPPVAPRADDGRRAARTQ